MSHDYIVVHNLNTIAPAPFGLTRRGREYKAAELEGWFTATAHDWNEDEANRLWIEERTLHRGTLGETTAHQDLVLAP
jgi:hypothetical protein